MIHVEDLAPNTHFIKLLTHITTDQQTFHNLLCRLTLKVSTISMRRWKTLNGSIIKYM